MQWNDNKERLIESITLKDPAENIGKANPAVDINWVCL
jgi:hypothetical protein